MKTKLTDAQKIERIAQKHDDWSFRGTYSGRCMFGDVCPGIVCPTWDIRHVEGLAKKAGIKARASFDSMGLDNIVYWTSIKSDPDAVEA
jgi:hypothetical protein